MAKTKAGGGKKRWTQAERNAFRDKMAAARAAKSKGKGKAAKRPKAAAPPKAKPKPKPKRRATAASSGTGSSSKTKARATRAPSQTEAAAQRPKTNNKRKGGMVARATRAGGGLLGFAAQSVKGGVGVISGEAAGNLGVGLMGQRADSLLGGAIKGAVGVVGSLIIRNFDPDFAEHFAAGSVASAIRQVLRQTGVRQVTGYLGDDSDLMRNPAFAAGYDSNVFNAADPFGQLGSGSMGDDAAWGTDTGFPYLGEDSGLPVGDNGVNLWG